MPDGAGTAGSAESAGTFDAAISKALSLLDDQPAEFVEGEVVKVSFCASANPALISKVQLSNENCRFKENRKASGMLFNLR